MEKSVNITSFMKTVSTTLWNNTPWSSSFAPIRMKKSGDDEQRALQQSTPAAKADDAC